MKLSDLLAVLVYHQDIVVTYLGKEMYRGIKGHYVMFETLDHEPEVIIVTTVTQYLIDIEIR